MPLDPDAPLSIRAAEALRRRDIDHTPFSSGPIKLSFGREVASESLIHVRHVPRGQNCGCVCPACGANLLSRQGDMLSWHFAHASGDTCGNALDAALLGWLAQVMQNGASLTLPTRRVYWGRRTIDFPNFDAPLTPDGQPQDHPELGWHLPLRTWKKDRITLHLRTQARRPPRRDPSHPPRLIIDMHNSFTHAATITPDPTADPDWISAQLLADAPRLWAPDDPGDEAHAQVRATRIDPYLAARRAPGHELNASCLDDLHSSSLAHVLHGIDGAAITPSLGLPERIWTRLILERLCLRPARDNLPCETGFCIEDAARVLVTACGVSPALFGPDGPATEYDSDDHLEMERVGFSYADPRQDILRLFERLWAQAVLVRRINTLSWTIKVLGPIAPLESGHVGRDWQVLPELHARLYRESALY